MLKHHTFSFTSFCIEKNIRLKLYDAVHYVDSENILHYWKCIDQLT